MRHFDSDGPLLQMHAVEPAAEAAPDASRDYLLLEDLVGDVVEFDPGALSPLGEARPGWH